MLAHFANHRPDAFRFPALQEIVPVQSVPGKNVTRDVNPVRRRVPGKRPQYTADPDGGARMVETWMDRLPIRYFRQDTNIGPHPNLAFAYEQSRSPFTMYLADDDLLDVRGLDAALGTLVSDPEIVVLYAPWTLVDLVNNKTLSKFYDIAADTKVMRGNFLHLLSLILQNHIFAEISIFKTEAFRSLFPTPPAGAHWAFTVPGEYLSLGNVMDGEISKQAKRLFEKQGMLPR